MFCPSRRLLPQPLENNVKRLRYLLTHAVLDMFPMSFYGADARERLASFTHSLRYWLTPALNILTVTVSIVTILVVASIYEGGIRWIRENINENPLATRITFAKQTGGVPEFTRLMQPFSDELPTLPDEQHFDTKLLNPRELAFLNGQFAQAAAERAQFTVKGAYGWSDMQMWLIDTEGLADKRGHTTGQILQRGDTLLNNLDVRPVTPDGTTGFIDEGEGQIVVTDRLLKHLGYGDLEAFRKTPGVIRVKYARRFSGSLTEREEPLKVVGVVRTLPYGEYVVAEDFGHRFRAQEWSPTKFYDSARLGQFDLPRDEAQKRAERHAGYLKNNGVTAAIDGKDGAVHFNLPRKGRIPWNRERWSGFLKRVSEKLEIDLANETKIAWPDPLRAETESRSMKGYMNCSLDVARVEEVPAAADLLYGLGFNVKSSAKDQALLLIQLSRFGQGLLAAIIGIVGILSVVGIGLSFAQTIQRKTKEIGIFKAFGSTNAEVGVTFVFQAVIIWTIAFAIAAGAATTLGGWTADGLAALIKLDVETANLDSMSGRVLGYTAIGTFLLCMAAVTLGGSLALRLQPAQALRSL